MQTDDQMGVREGRLLGVCRRMWKRWWMGLPVDMRQQVCAELCILPRGTASDQGWLVIDPSVPLDESSEKISECFEIAESRPEPRFLPAAGPADTSPCPRPSPRDSGS